MKEQQQKQIIRKLHDSGIVISNIIDMRNKNILEKCPLCGKNLPESTLFCENCCMKYCQNCGKKINDEDSYCPYCGYEPPVRGLISHYKEIIRFDFSYPTSKVMEKYWNNKCTNLAKKRLELYGLTVFYGSHGKGRSIFEQCLTKEQFKKFLEEYKSTPIPRKDWKKAWFNALDWYAEALLYKKGIIQKYLKKFKLKKCLNCGKKFTPLIIDSRAIKAFIPKKNCNEVNFCGQCLAKAFYGIKLYQPGSRGWIQKTKLKIKPKKEMLKDLQDFVNALGFIPPRDYVNNKRFREGIKERFNELISILVKIEPPKIYREKFGSWLKALVKAGVLRGKVRVTPRGIMCVSKDNHDCNSLAERKIDDWLYNHKIKHAKEPKYPKDKKLNPNKLMRADWKVGNIFIEFFGLSGNLGYDKKSEFKRKLCKKYNIKMIEIFNRDLDNLTKKLKKLKGK